MDKHQLQQIIRTVPDWPKPGVSFFDICPIVEHPDAFSWTVNQLTQICADEEMDAIVCPDARGFIWGAAVAYAAKLPLHLARKPGKLPGQTVTQSYNYEYAASSISMQASCELAGKKVIIIDDVLATGGTAFAIVSLLKNHFRVSEHSIHLASVINLEFLGGEQLLRDTNVTVHSILTCHG
ncbi:MAG: adenine phosphoribosyltransferase [Verrucomicrobiota bacterium]